MNGWRTALRIARREARRARGRSALVVALIGIPALGLSFAAVSYDSFDLTIEERLPREMGAGDAQLRWQTRSPVEQDFRGFLTGTTATPTESEPAEPTTADLLDLLPSGSTALPRWDGSVLLETDAGIGQVESRAFDLAAPMTDGIARITDGRAPAAPDEVALTDAAANRVGIGVGDRIQLVNDGAYTVVGAVEFPGVPGDLVTQPPPPGLVDEVVVFHPDGRPGDAPPRRWLVDTPASVTWDLVRELNQHGVQVRSRAVVLDPPPEAVPSDGSDDDAFVAGTVVAGLAAFEIVLLAGPAFAVGARRRRRELALVAAGGGTPAQLRRIVLADGVVLGVVAAVGGVLLGVAVALAGRPLLEEYLAGARAGGPRLFPAALLGIVGFSVVTGVVAALVPAVTAGRTRVVDALAGRRGATGFRRRWLALGVLLAVIGTGVAAAGAWRTSAPVVLAGLVAGQLGLALCTPAVIGLIARLGPALTLGPRIALRDTARNRAAAAPAVAAVMAVVAGAVAAGVAMASFEAREAEERTPSYPPGTVTAGATARDDPDSPATAEELERAARATLPVARVHQLREPERDCGDGAGTTCALVAVVPEENRCPYVPFDPADPFGVPPPRLSPAEEASASEDPRCAGDYRPVGGQIFVGEPSALAGAAGVDDGAAAEAAEVLRDGGAVVTDDRYLADGRVTLLRTVHDDSRTLTDRTELDLPGYLLSSEVDRQGAFVTPETLHTAGVGTRPGPLLIATEDTPTQEQADAFRAQLRSLEAWASVTREPRTLTPLLVALTGVAVLVALGAAAIATGLAAVDRRPDLATLAAVGAEPRVRRRMSLSHSGVVAGLGTVLGVVSGVGAAAAVLSGMNQRYAGEWPGPEPLPLAVPWPYLLGLLVVPALAGLGAALLTRSRLPVERRAG